MSFWDASAVIPLCIREPGLSDEMWGLMREQSLVVAWWGTPVELASVLMQQVRLGTITLEAAQRAMDVVEKLRDAWAEIVASRGCYFRALHVTRHHELPVASVMQLAAALTWVKPRPPDKYAFVSLDPKLREAATLEGFRILPEKLPPVRRCVPGSAGPLRTIT